jgi:hypothetical protein
MKKISVENLKNIFGISTAFDIKISEQLSSFMLQKFRQLHKV